MSEKDEKREAAMAKFRELVASAPEPADGCLAGRWPPGPDYTFSPMPPDAHKGLVREGDMRIDGNYLYTFRDGRWEVWVRDTGTSDPRTVVEVTERIAYRVKQRRELANMTRAELGRRAGISSSYVTHIENGRRLPTIPVLVDIAAVFGLTMSELLQVEEVVSEQG